MSQTTIGAVASRLGIPLAYLKKSPEDLQSHNLEYWLRQERNEKLFVRFDGARLRAVFTPRYTPVDNVEVIDRLLGMGIKPETPVRCQLDEDFLHLSVSDSSRAFAVRDKDKIEPGVSITNSEVGLSSLSVSAFFMRLVCTNGLVSQTEVGARYRHPSRSILDEFPETLRGVGCAVEGKMGQFRFSLESPVSDPVTLPPENNPAKPLKLN